MKSLFDPNMPTIKVFKCPICNERTEIKNGQDARDGRFVCSVCGARTSPGLAELLAALKDLPAAQPLAETLQALRVLGFSVRHGVDHLEITGPHLDESWEFQDRLPATAGELIETLIALSRLQSAEPLAGPVPPEERIRCPKCKAVASRHERKCQWCGAPLS